MIQTHNTMCLEAAGRPPGEGGWGGCTWLQSHRPRYRFRIRMDGQTGIQLLTTTCRIPDNPPPPQPPPAALSFCRASSAPRITRAPPCICEPEGEDTCDQRPVTWQPSQKAFCAGIYSPKAPPSTSRHPPRFHPRGPLAPPRSLEEIHCPRPCFLSCLPPPDLQKQDSSEERKGNFLSFCPR